MHLTFLDTFEFGIPKIDLEHRRIVILFNQIGELLEGGNFDTALRVTIHLIAVERSHVRYETSLLVEFGYTQIDKHDEYHRVLFRSLNDMMDALADQNRPAAEASYGKLLDCIVDDILKADLPFKSLFQDRILDI